MLGRVVNPLEPSLLMDLVLSTLHIVVLLSSKAPGIIRVSLSTGSSDWSSQLTLWFLSAVVGVS